MFLFLFKVCGSLRVALPHFRYPICTRQSQASGHYYTVAPAKHTGDVTVTLPLTVTVWDGDNFEILAGQAP